jgi:integral membrane protein (TIGR01906 family)
VTNTEKSKSSLNLLWSFVRLYVVIAVPVLLVIASVRVVMTTQFLNFEYNRAGFPQDTYGFSTQDRMEYGQHGILYLLNDSDIAYLADRELPGALCYPPDETDCSMFNTDELSHMEDVKVVTHGTFIAGQYAALLAIVCVLLLWKYFSIAALRLSLLQGSFLTLGLIATIILLALTAWDMFFTIFHSFFFEAGTWRFYFSDTLIRLYPEQFWFDAALVVGGLTTLGAIIILGVTLGWRIPSQTLP